ncbi:fasciclin domain-containing protein [Nocardia grenadensis]|uniref:fasciclin domain-containing protein n=1 Tax=Nocardia grenadensis TaxID=931537 RepID=UPI003D8A1BC0
MTARKDGSARATETGPDAGAGRAPAVPVGIEPVTVAASNNPLLTTLAAAVSGGFNPEVDLAEALDRAEYTVFAPVDSAFAALDPATLEVLRTDSATLMTILTYHAVPGRIAPEAIDGVLGTAEGSDVAVARSGDRITVNNATVIGGGVETANATVYLIDRVLIPPTVNRA